ncbi:hypothetical protein PO878_05700 [Iamia majanohamensis]|uniref:Uncharacterized protein n=1 Tax=Iamia majanohamensis TaxID=467976 RepID=A0AAE9YBY1_9ACTN|nr:hypothetical protein [Iamia majanohamensis]WCO68219.1 hypothetical protein PO878_05700 [Iamia majanohamensis]
MSIAIGVLVVLVVVAGAALLARRVQHPEDAASHDDGQADTTSERFYDTADRPAGPDADDPVGPAHLDEGDVPPGPGRD